MNLTDTTNFDIATYLKDDPGTTPEKYSKKHRAGVKKIDMKAQKYIIDEEDDVDVETVSECGDASAIIQAGDLDSLLEQFEASEVPDLTLPEDFLETTSSVLNNDIPAVEKVNIPQDNLLEESRTECKPVVKIKQNDEKPDLKIKQEIPVHECIDFDLKYVKKEINCSDINVDDFTSNVKKEIVKDSDIKKQSFPGKQEDIKTKIEKKYFLKQGMFIIKFSKCCTIENKE